MVVGYIESDNAMGKQQPAPFTLIMREKRRALFNANAEKSGSTDRITSSSTKALVDSGALAQSINYNPKHTISTFGRQTDPIFYPKKKALVYVDTEQLSLTWMMADMLYGKEQGRSTPADWSSLTIKILNFIHNGGTSAWGNPVKSRPFMTFPAKYWSRQLKLIQEVAYKSAIINYLRYGYSHTSHTVLVDEKYFDTVVGD